MQNHFDVIILGDSLAARIAAVQLARGGCRVLILSEDQSLSPAWFTSSLQLEKLLDQLSGRSCLTPLPGFQVITPAARVEVSPRYPLDEELLREFPHDGAALQELLESLQKRGSQLEAALSESRRAPLKGLGGGLRFRWRALRGGLGFGAGKTSLRSHLQKLELSEEAVLFLLALFSGLALLDVNSLTLDEAALLWSSHAREHGASASGLDSLLQQRYAQFHGQSEELANVRQIEVNAQQVSQVVLKNGSSCTADTFLVANPEQLTSLLPELGAGKLALPSAPARVVTSELAGMTSPLLSRRVILSGPPHLRLSFGKRGEATLCALDLPRNAELPSREELTAQLAPVLPFCTYSLEMPAPAPVPGVAARGNRFGQQHSARLLRNTLLCHGASIFPALGTTGEVLLGSTLAEHLLARRPKKS